MKSLWIASSLFLVLACSWFAAMELILHHPGFVVRAAVAAAIVLYAALCLAYTRTPSPALRSGLTFGALATFLLGLYALLTSLRSTHFEGYILLISLGLIAQSLFTRAGTIAHPRLRAA